jgi:hypothetical protein
METARIPCHHTVKDPAILLTGISPRDHDLMAAARKFLRKQRHL